MKSSVFHTPKRGDSRVRRINLKCSLHTKNEWRKALVNQEYVVNINRHRSCELNKKSGVFPTPKRGGINVQS